MSSDFVARALAQRALKAVGDTQGADAYEVAVAAGFVGSRAAWLASLKGENGVGLAGKDAYQVAVDAGFGGDRAAWLASLKGDDGIGTPGKDAYQVAVDAGFSGDRTAWLISLQGPPGSDADPSDISALQIQLGEALDRIAVLESPDTLTPLSMDNHVVAETVGPDELVGTVQGIHPYEVITQTDDAGGRLVYSGGQIRTGPTGFDYATADAHNIVLHRVLAKPGRTPVVEDAALTIDVLEVVTLDDLPLDDAIFSLSEVAGAELADLGPRLPGELRTISPDDGRIVFNDDQSKLLRGPAEWDVGDIEYALTRSLDGAVNSPHVTSWLVTVEPTTSNVVRFGALNDAGTGDYPVAATAIVSGNEAGHFQLSGGAITLSAAGADADLSAGPYRLVLNDGTNLDVDVVPNAYVIGKQADWSTGTGGTGVGHLGPDVLEGKQVRFRPISLTLGINGNIGAGTPLWRQVFGTAAKGWLGLVLCADDLANKPILTDATQVLAGIRFLTIRGFQRAAGSNAPMFTILENQTRPITDIWIDKCVCIAPEKPLSSDPGNLYRDVGVNAYNPNNFFTTNGTTWYSNIAITDCDVRYMRGLGSFGIRAPLPDAGHIVPVAINTSGNLIIGAWAILIQCSGGGNGYGVWRCRFNYMTGIVSMSGDNGIPHQDGLLAAMDDVAGSDFGLEIEGNRIIAQGSRGPMPPIACRDASKDIAKGISGVTSITAANPGVVTIGGAPSPASRALVTGQRVFISGSTSMSALNGREYTIQVISPTTFSLKTYPEGVPVDTSSLGAFAPNEGITITRYTGYGFVGRIVGNVCNGRTSSEGIVVQNIGSTIPSGQTKAMILANNTVAKPDYPSANAALIVAGFSLPNGTAWGESEAVRNIAEAINGANLTRVENVETGANSGYEATLVGPAWAPTSASEVMAFLAMKRGGPAESEPEGEIKAGAIGSGAVNWPTALPGSDGVIHA